MTDASIAKSRLIWSRPASVLNGLLHRWSAIRTYWFLRRRGVTTRLGYVTLLGRPMIQRCAGSEIILGNGCVLLSSAEFNPAGVTHPVVLATLRPGARIELAGKNGLSGATICAAESVYLGPHAGMGANSSIYDTDFHPLDAGDRRRQKGLDATVKVRPVTIGPDVWIAANAMILKGIEVGEAAVIAAGAIVTRNVPARAVVAGNPAKVVKILPESIEPSAELTAAAK